MYIHNTKYQIKKHFSFHVNIYSMIIMHLKESLSWRKQNFCEIGQKGRIINANLRIYYGGDKNSKCKQHLVWER